MTLLVLKRGASSSRTNQGGKLQGRVYVPVKEAERRIQVILEAIRRLAQALG